MNNSGTSKFNKIYKMVSDFKHIIYSNICGVLDRYGRRQNYPWIDTKYNVADGSEYPANDPFRGTNTIYAWIQGRGIEALAGHIDFFTKYHKNDSRILIEQLKNILKIVVEELSKIRTQCGGHLYFFMDSKGTPFTFDSSGRRVPVVLTSHSPYNFSDLFCAKGMYAAAKAIENNDLALRAKQYCFDVTVAIKDGAFISDQYQFDKNNPVKQLSGRKSHAPFMLQIGAMTLMILHEKDQMAVETGLQLIEHIIDNHVNRNKKFNALEEFDFIEFLDNNNHPWTYKGQILSDPGHALEFVGLSSKFIQTTKNLIMVTDEWKNRICRIESILPEIFKQNFHNGFQPQLGGICKSFDLVKRIPVNRDMPWWSLPETIRAALYCWQNGRSASEQTLFFEIANECYRCFIQNYIIPERNMMPIQNRSGDGRIASAIPAVPDNDPCYHTGLSLIDAVELLAKIITVCD